MSERARNKSLQKRLTGFGLAVGLTAASVGLAGCAPSQPSVDNEVWISVTQSSSSGVDVQVVSAPNKESTNTMPEQPAPAADWGLLGKWALAIATLGGGLATYVAWIKHSREERSRRESAEYRAKQEENLRVLRAQEEQERQKAAAVSPPKSTATTVPTTQPTTKAPVKSIAPLQSGVAAAHPTNQEVRVVTAKSVPTEDTGIWGVMEGIRNPPPPVIVKETEQEAALRKQKEQAIAREQRQIREAEIAARNLIVQSFHQIQTHEQMMRGQDTVVNYRRNSSPHGNFVNLVTLLNEVWLVELSWGSPNPGEQRKRIVARIGSASNESAGYGRDGTGRRIMGPVDDARRYVIVYGAKEVGRRYYIGTNRFSGDHPTHEYNLFPKRDGGVYIPKELVWSRPTTSFEEDLAQLFIDALKQPETYQNPYSKEQLEEFERARREAQERESKQLSEYDPSKDPYSSLYNTGTY